jgi:hypothetical protein
LIVTLWMTGEMNAGSLPLFRGNSFPNSVPFLVRDSM